MPGGPSVRASVSQPLTSCIFPSMWRRVGSNGRFVFLLFKIVHIVNRQTKHTEEYKEKIESHFDLLHPCPLCCPLLRGH